MLNETRTGFSMAKWRFLFCACVLLLTQSTNAAATYGYALTNSFTGVSFANPVCITSPPVETNRLFVLEKRGRVVVITNLASPTRAIFMDITSRVTNSFSDSNVGDERGLLGMAFHPGYATNGFFYLCYTTHTNTSAGTGTHDVLSRFHVSGASTNQGDAS